MLDLALRHSKTVLAATAALFVLSLVGMRFVPQQFFPKSDRPELFVDLTLPHSASLQATAGGRRSRREAPQGRSRHRALELLRRPGRDPLLPAARCPARQRLLRPGRGRHQGPRAARSRRRAAGEGVRARLRRCHGARDAAGARAARRLAAEVPRQRSRSRPRRASWRMPLRRCSASNPNTRNINYDWNEPAKVIKVEVDQDRARALGISSQQLANSINAILSGTTHHPAARCHLPDRRRRPRRAGGARQASRPCATST